MIEAKGLKYKLIISILMGMAGFIFNFINVKIFQIDNFSLFLLPGLIFPLLTALAWGGKYGVISALCGGCQTMWLLWTVDGWGMMFSVSIYTAWVYWHGWWAEWRDKQKENKWYYSPFVVEIYIRVLIIIGFFSVYPFFISFNPANSYFFQSDDVTLTMLLLIIIKQTISAYLLLVVCSFLFYFSGVRIIFSLKKYYEQRKFDFIICAVLFTGAGFLIFDGLIYYLFYNPNNIGFARSVAGIDQPYRIFIRSGFSFFCILGGWGVLDLIKNKMELKMDILRLNQVLSSIRNVNQLITHEKDPKELVGKICRILTENDRYSTCWVVLSRTPGIVDEITSIGLKRNIDHLMLHLIENDFFPCCNKVFEKKNMVLYERNREKCHDCPYGDDYSLYYVFLKLTKDDELFGYLTVSLESDVDFDEKERDLLIEVTDDITYALKLFDMEKNNAIAEKRLSDNAKVFSSFMDNLPAGIFIQDREIRMLYANHYMRNNILKGKDWNNKTPLEIFPLHMGKKMMLDSKRVFDEGVIVKKEIASDETGNRKHYKTIMFLIEGCEKSKIGGAVWDITDMEKAYEQLENSREALREAQEIAQLGSYEVDLKTRKWKASETLNRILGGPNRSDTVDDWLNQIHPEEKERVSNYLRRNVLENYEFLNREFRIIRRNDERVRWVKALGELIFDENGEPIKLIGTIQDVTDRKIKRNLLEEKNAQLMTLLDNVRQGIVFEDEKGKIVLVNRMFCNYLDMDNPYLLQGKSINDQYVRIKKVIKDPDDFINKVLSLYEEKKQVEKELITTVDDKYYERDFIPVFMKGEMFGFLWVYEDVTDRKKNELELIDSRKKAREANDLKGRFLRNMSHELRTPLNGIIGMTSLCQELIKGEKEKEYLDNIQSSSYHLLGLVNDLLDFSKIESNQLNIKKKSFNLEDLFLNVERLISPKADIKGLDFEMDLDSSCTGNFLSDMEKIQQVIINLLDNAIKYTKQGKVFLRGKVLDGKDLRFEVEDTGIGIKEKDIPSIFESFRRLDASYTRRFGGVGIGLSIVKNIVDRLNGGIEVSSVWREGSLFKVSIPLEKQEMEESEIVRIESYREGAPKSVLLVEDDPVNLEVFSRFIKRLGHEVEIVENGRDALDRIISNKYDIVFMDIGLPIMSGLEVIKKIRARKEINIGKTPMIALTAHAHEMDKEEFIKAGANYVVVKPAEQEDIKKAIENYALKE